MNPDPRWLEILKASGWQLFSIALACGLFLLAASWDLIPALEPWMKQLAFLSFLITSCLAATSLISNTLKFFALGNRFKRYFARHKEQKDLEEYIPYMTEPEKVIIGYLLAKNIKTITVMSDGGYASTLLSRGIIRTIGTNGPASRYDSRAYGCSQPLLGYSSKT